MLSIAHSVTGAYLAANLPSVWLFVPLALASHFLLDRIKHFDVGTGLKHSQRKLQWTLFWAITDLLIAALLIIVFWRQTPTSFNWQIWLGAFCGILPDLLESSNLFFKKKFNFLQPLYHFHEKIHRSTNNIFWGLLPQIIVVTLIGLLTILNW